jgi:hypothetical protein
MLKMMSATRTTDAFVDLVCADEELLRAEFDELIRAGWPDDSPGAAPHPPAPRPRSTGRPHGTAHMRAGTGAPAVRHGGSERAPPAEKRHRAR